MTIFQCPICRLLWVEDNDNDEPQRNVAIAYCSEKCEIADDGAKLT